MNFICEYVDTLLTYQRLLQTKMRSKIARKVEVKKPEKERLKKLKELRSARDSYGQRLTPQEERYLRSVFPYDVPNYTTQSELPHRKYVEERILTDAKLILDHGWLSGGWKEQELLKTTPSETQIARIRNNFTLVDYIPKSAIAKAKEIALRSMVADCFDYRSDGHERPVAVSRGHFARGDDEIRDPTLVPSDA